MKAAAAAHDVPAGGSGSFFGRHESHPRLRRRLLVALGTPLMAIALFGAWLDWRRATTFTDDAYDQAMVATAEALAVRIETDADRDAAVHLDAAMALMGRIDAPDRWRYLVLDAGGHVLAGDALLRGEWQPGPAGMPRFHNHRGLGHMPAERVVSYEHVGHEGRAMIIIAETTRRRDSAVRDLVGATLLPNAAMVVLSLLIIVFGVRYAVRPLDALGARVAARAPDDFALLPLAGTPAEALPLLRSLNALLARMRAASRTQQAFLNQAAHQLRTPLAGLQAQIELWRESPPDDASERLAVMHRTVLRLGHLTRRLLALARADASVSGDLVRERVALDALVVASAAEWDEAAMRHGCGLRFEADEACVDGVPWMLRELLQNLVDNAMAHAPPDTDVRVACGTDERGDAWLEVEDAGPGIPAAHRDRVLKPFVRLDEDTSPGTGLGLAIVNEIVQLHGARLSIDDGPGGLGTVVRVTFGTSLKPAVTPGGSSAI
jgi:two-component system sensor histidine kinase TctE